MYKVLIVDDESIERQGLRKIISEAFSPIIIEEADNGRTAILKAEEFRPDVVFMDIKMPGIDGVEAAKEIKNMNRTVQIIMVTAFDTFEYARQVMQIGVRDYILKPSTKEEILTPLKKILDEIEMERKKRTEEIILKDNYKRALSIIQSRVITSMLIEHSSGGRNIEELEIEQTFQKESFVMVFEFNKKNNPTEYKEIKEFIPFLQAELSHYFRNHFIGEEHMGRLPVLIQLTDREKSLKISIRDRAVTCGNEIIKKTSQSYPQYELSIGIGRVYSEMDRFVQSYHEALFTLSVLKHPNMCQYYSQYVEKEEDNENVNYPYHLEKKLLGSVTSGVVGEVPSHFNQYIDALVRYCDKTNETVEEKMSEFFILLSRQIADFGISISYHRDLEIKSIPQVQDQLTSIAQHIQTRYYSQSKDILQVAKDYIVENFEKAITLEEVAEIVQLSPQYFSKVFKERAGTSFIDYLTEIRVERAKDLMRMKEKSMKEVCYEIGYKDPNYFSRVFKKHTGQSPSEYRQSIN